MPPSDRDPYPSSYILRPFRILFFLWGIYAPRRLRANPCYRIFRKILLPCLFGSVFLSTAIVARSYYYFRHDLEKGPNVFGCLLLLIEQLVATYYVMKWVCTKSAKTVLIYLRLANEERGIKARFRRHLLCFAFICAIIILTVTGTVLGAIFLPRERDDMFLRDPLLGKFFWFGFAYGIGSWLMANSIFTTCCHFIQSEFMYLNNDIVSLDTITSDKLQSLLRTHLQLSKAVQKANAIFGNYIFAMFAVNVPLVVLILYNMYTSTSTPRTLFLGFLLAMSFLQLSSLTFIPAQIYDESVRTGDVIRLSIGMREEIWSDTQACNLAMWLLRQAESQAGMSAAGYFVVTKSLALTVASAIVTYLTLLVDKSSLIQSYANGTLLPMSDRAIWQQ